MPNWITSPGFLSNVTKDSVFVYGLSCDNEAIYTTFQIIAGSLPNGQSVEI